MKIVVLDGFVEASSDISWEPLGSLGELTVYDRSIESEDQAIARIGDAEIVIVNKTQITKKILDACPGIKYIAVLATGYNIIDAEYAKEMGIWVSNVPSYGTAIVAQFSIALLLELCHRIGDHNEGVHAGKWEASEDFCYWDYPQMELDGKTIGIIGFGRIGQREGRIAKALGMRVLANDIFETESGKEIGEYVDIDTLYRESDIISLHCNLTAENTEMIDVSAISKMKDGVLIINDSRGQLINEKDLAEALRSGKVAGAAVDVVSEEPIKGDNPLLTAPNCIITPHIAWAAKESRQRIMDTTVENVKGFLRGEPVNVVNL